MKASSPGNSHGKVRILSYRNDDGNDVTVTKSIALSFVSSLDAKSI